MPIVLTHVADVRNYFELRRVYDYFNSFGYCDIVISTAGIGGYAASLGKIPDDIFLSERDSIINNLYGSINVMRTAI